MSISSSAFTDETRYPPIVMTDGTEQKIKLRMDQRINENFAAAQADGASSDEAFWFVMKGHYIYYFSSKKDINVLDSIYVNSFQNNRKHFSQYSGVDDSCIDVIDKMDSSYTLCFKSREIKLSWICSMEKLFDQKLEIECVPPEEINRPDFDFSKYKLDIKEIKDVQPVIIIPRGSRKCNDGWNYNMKGADWECGCKEGRKQSPIDLPSKNKAELTTSHPMFQYEEVESITKFSTLDGYIQDKQKVKISHFKGAIRILHPKLGKLVTEEGGIYFAEEIVFHTPSEHKINGERFDLEMQVIHYGRSVGDIAKQVVLSFLFKKTPGIYNKFMDSINFTDLPNPLEKTKFIENDFSIFQVLYTPDEKYEDFGFKPFSFFSYEGSLTFPPCTERTTHLVASDPIPLSSTIIGLFQEALLKPDLLGDEIGLMDANGSLENIRDIQPLNGRIVSIYDHWKLGCGQIKKPIETSTNGHYEKRLVDVPHYVFLNTNEPSGLPGSIVVSEEEARGISIKDPEEKEDKK
jgi:carbonic anhydrase